MLVQPGCMAARDKTFQGGRYDVNCKRGEVMFYNIYTSFNNYSPKARWLSVKFLRHLIDKMASAAISKIA
jgi:hypothetical protein